MLLPSHFIGFCEPFRNLGVEFLDGFYLKVVYKTARAEFVDLCKSGMLNAACEHQVTLHAAAAETVYCCEYHSDLKADPRLCRCERDRAAGLDHLAETLEKSDRFRRFTTQKSLDRIFAARMRMIRLYKRPSAFRAVP